MSVHFGTLQVSPAAGSGLVAVQIAGVGLVPGMQGPTLGYSREHFVAAREGGVCRIIVLEWPRDPALARELAASIERSAAICAASNAGESTR